MLEFPSPALARYAGIALLPFVATVASAQSRDAVAADSAAPITFDVAAATTTAPVTSPAPVTTTSGPTIAGATSAARVSRDQTNANAKAANMAGQHTSQSTALMIVGGTAVVLGILVGGDAQAPLIVGGAVVGLLGLYQYLH